MAKWKFLDALRAKLPLRWSPKPPPVSYMSNSASNPDVKSAPPASQWSSRDGGAVTTSYGEQIDQYLRDLEDYFKNSTESAVTARKRLEDMLSEQAKAQEEHRREYMQTFIPLVFLLILFMREQMNRSCAEQTHLVLREHAEKYSSLKRVIL